MGEPMKNEIQLFEDQKIRVAWDAEREEWYFSIVDVAGVLTDSPDYNTGRKYWNKLKQRLKDEGNELVTNCHQLKMRAADGKNRLTDVADTEQLLRIIQSIPSKKAEPFKAWLAMVGRERIEETIDPEQAIDRALETYLKKGYSEEWVHQRLLAIRIRNELTDEWKKRGGNVAGVARKALEAETGKPVVTAQNAESFRQLVTDIVTDAAQLPEQMEENANGK
ncbi:MAG: Bro-N domain-containing protein [Oscillospiraceae bacterium]